MSLVAKDVLSWCKRIMTEVQEDGGTSRVELWHQIEGEGGERINTFKNLAESDPEDLAQAIWDSAEADAKTRTVGMIQRYSMQAFVDSEESDGMPEYMHAVVMRGGQAGDLFGDDSEPATPAGRMKQDMRHTEALHRMLLGMTESVAGRLARDYAEERKARVEAENRNLQIVELYQKLMDRQHERDLERAREVQGARRDDQVMGLIMTVAPLILAKFLPMLGGAPQLPGAPPPTGGTPQQSQASYPLAGSPRSIALGQIMMGLASNQAKATEVISSLTQLNQLAVMQLIQSYMSSPPGADKAQDDIRDVSIKHLLASLSATEVMSILSALDKESRDAFMLIYKSYREEEARADAERPDILKQQPTKEQSDGEKESQAS